jgi:hypothetical protein
MRQDPHEPTDRLEAFRKSAALEDYFDALNLALARADLPMRSGDGEAARGLPILYVVGVPRSGTTLLSQLISRYLPVGYIDNLIARFWLRPSVGIRLSRAVLGTDARREIRLQSTHGATAGVAGPHEFGYFWRHWLGLDRSATHKLDPEELARIDATGLKDALEVEILGSFGAPTVFKNVICGLQASFLSGLHPSSVFVMIHRDPVDAAQSILRARQARYGSESKWWSLKPSSYQEIVEIPDPIGQVARQVRDIHREMTAELRRPGVRALHVDYSRLCEDPAGTLRRIGEHWCHGATDRIEPLEEAISPLEPSTGGRLDPGTRDRLCAAFDELGPDDTATGSA